MTVRLVSGHPDDNHPDSSVEKALAATYGNEWPRETAYRFLHALSTGAQGIGAPSEKDLAAFVKAPVQPLRVRDGVFLYEAVHGSERVAAEIVGHVERRADALWSLTDRADHMFALLEALGPVRDRMTHSDRSRLDARIRVLLAFHAKDALIAKELSAILERPESIAPPPMEPEPEAKPKKPAKKKAAKKKAK